MRHRGFFCARRVTFFSHASCACFAWADCLCAAMLRAAWFGRFSATMRPFMRAGRLCVTACPVAFTMSLDGFPLGTRAPRVLLFCHGAPIFWNAVLFCSPGACARIFIWSAAHLLFPSRLVSSRCFLSDPLAWCYVLMFRCAHLKWRAWSGRGGSDVVDE